MRFRDPVTGFIYPEEWVSACGKECEVPFKPTEGRPVYCRDCLPKHRKPRY